MLLGLNVCFFFWVKVKYDGISMGGFKNDDNVF